MTEQTLESNKDRPAAATSPWPSPEAREVLDSMTEFFVALDRSYKIVFVNRALNKATPEGSPTLLGKNHWELWPEMRGTVVEESYERAFTLRLPVSFEYHHESSGFWVSVTAYPQDELLHVFFKDVTQARRAEAEHREREDHLRAMVDSIPQIAWAMGEDMAPTHLNRRWYEYTGLEEDSSYDASAVVHPDDLGELARLWARARERGEGLQGEARLRRHDGEYRWHLIRVEPRRQGDRVVGWFGTSTDVHDMKTADQRLASTTDAVPAFIAFIDADLVYRFCNRLYQEWFGLPLDQIVGRHLREVVGEPSFERLRPHLDRALAGDRADYEMWLDFPQGRRFMRASYVPSFDEGGRVLGINALIADETDLKQAQEREREATAALRESDARFRRVVEAGVVPMAFFSLDGRYTDCNDAFVDLLGFSKEEVLEGRARWTELTPPEWVPRTRQALEELSSTGRIQPYEKEYLRKDGTRFWGLFGGAFIAEGEGIMYVLDVTEARRAQEMLRATADALPAFLAYMDESLVYRFCNRTYEEAFARPREEIVGRTSSEVLGTEASVRIEPLLRRALAGEHVQEAKWLTFPGLGRRFVRMDYKPRLAHSGRAEGVYVLAVDETEQTEAHARFAESEALAQSVLNTVVEGVLVLGADGSTILSNAAFDRLHYADGEPGFGSLGGFEQSFELRDGNGALVPPERWPAARALRGERIEGCDLLVRRTDSGREFWGSYSAAPVVDGEGRVQTVVLSVADVTDRVLAERGLRDAKARTEGVLASADVATWVLDVQNDRVYADRNLARMFGADEAMANGGRSGEYVARMHPDDRERVAAALGRAMAEGAPYDVEYRIVGEEERWVTARGIPEKDGSGAVARLPGVVVDVTQLKKAEERERATAAALRESSERFRLLVESVPEIAWTSRPDGYLDYYNERWYEYTGRQRGQGGDESWTPLLHPDDLEGTYASWSRSVETGEPYEIELRLREAATGEFRWFLARARPLRDGEGRIVRWFGVTSDIDEQKRAQRSLSFLVELEDRLRPLDDPAAMMRAVAEMLGEHLCVDRCAYAEVEDDEDHFTIQGDYTRGDAISIVGRYAMREFGDRALDLHRRGEEFVVNDADLEVDDAGERETYRATQIQAVISVPLLKNGRFAAGMAVHQRTPRRWTAEEVELVRMVVQRCWAHIEQTRLARAVHEELETKVRERTIDLQASNDALRSFTYHVSHDLRAPLRGIASTSRIVQEDHGDALPEEAVVLLDRQAEAATKLGRLIDDLLRLSRLSQKGLEKAPLDLTAIARETAGEAVGSHAGTKVRVVVDEGLTATADASLLRLAVGNLIENGVKYSPEGGTVRVGRREDGAFFVSDEGIGIDPKYFGKIFEPFQRLHLDSEFAGTGIGLSNVKQVIERHGGKVWVESEPGKGSIFLFTLG